MVDTRVKTEYASFGYVDLQEFRGLFELVALYALVQ